MDLRRLHVLRPRHDPDADAQPGRRQHMDSEGHRPAVGKSRPFQHGLGPWRFGDDYLRRLPRVRRRRGGEQNLGHRVRSRLRHAQPRLWHAVRRPGQRAAPEKPHAAGRRLGGLARIPALLAGAVWPCPARPDHAAHGRGDPVLLQHVHVLPRPRRQARAGMSRACPAHGRRGHRGHGIARLRHWRRRGAGPRDPGWLHDDQFGPLDRSPARRGASQGDRGLDSKRHDLQTVRLPVRRVGR